MSQNDDSMLNKFLAGKSSVSEIYQQGAQQQPPADLDARILAQAQQAVQEDTAGERHTRVVSRRPRWLVPASLAATLMLGINLAYQLKDTSLDAPYAENSSVVVDDRFEAKRQQAAKRKNQTANDADSRTQPAVQAMRNIDEPPTIDTRYSDHDDAYEQSADAKTLAETSPRLSTAPAAPTPSPQPTVVNKSQIVGSHADNAMPEPEAEIARDDIAYAPAPSTIAMHDDEGPSRTAEAQVQSTKTVATPKSGLPINPKELSPSRSASAGSGLLAEEKNDTKDADDTGHYAKSPEKSLSSIALESAPSRGFSQPGQSHDFYSIRKTETQSYVCDLTALGISDAEIEQKTLESADGQSRQSQSTWKYLIVVNVGRGDFRQACMELAAFHKLYPDATVREDFPVRLSD